jgi:hypothetical protein
MEHRQQPATPTGTAAGLHAQGEPAASQARESAHGAFDRTKQEASRRASHFARALHDTARRLRDEGEPTVGDYADWAASGLEGLSARLEHADIDRVGRRFGDLVRRQPVLLLGGVLLAGLAVSRALADAGARRGGRAAAEPAPGAAHEGVAKEGLEPPRTTRSGLHPRAEAEYGELETRRPGAPRR